METKNNAFSKNDDFSIDRRAIEIFSPEERSEISARIEAASVRDAVTLPGLPSKNEAARRGLFPLLVNAGAFLFLAAGLCLLFSFQQGGAVELHESGAVLGVTERALIEEIRNDALENLSAEGRAEVLAAREELAKLSGEAEKAALIERQLSGFYTGVSRAIEAGRFREAADTIAALKEFLATPSFASIKTIQARRESDAAAVNALSALVREALAASAIGGGSEMREDPSSSETGEALRQQLANEAAAALAEAASASNAILGEREKTLAERNATLAEREKTLAESQKTIADLREKNAEAQQTIAERDRQMESLRSQNASYLQTIERLQRTISSVNAALEEQ